MLKKRYDFMVLFEVENGNPNGDPDAGNLPRVDPETNIGLVTDVCIKRKIRNYVSIAKSGVEGYDIFIREGAVYNKILEEFTGDVKNSDVVGEDSVEEKKTTTKAKKKTKNNIKENAKEICSKYFDVRTFGAVLTTKSENSAQVRGPVQLSFAKSVDPITYSDHCITRVGVNKEEDVNDGKINTMGRKATVPYGLYKMCGYVSPYMAEKSGFTKDDLDLLWESIVNMFEHDHSAARGNMSVCSLIVFEHGSSLGECQAKKLFNLVTIKKNVDTPRSYEDYSVSIDYDNVPSNVTVKSMS